MTARPKICVQSYNHSLLEQEWREMLLHFKLLSSAHAPDHLPLYLTSGLRISAVSLWQAWSEPCSWIIVITKIQVARRARSGAHIAKNEGSGKRKAVRYECSSLVDEVFLHPNSTLYKAAPEYVVYQQLIRSTKRPYMTGDHWQHIARTFDWFSEMLWSWLVPCKCIVELWLLPWLT